jgi:hypothetical protein
MHIRVHPGFEILLEAPGRAPIPLHGIVPENQIFLECGFSRIAVPDQGIGPRENMHKLRNSVAEVGDVGRACIWSGVVSRSAG